MSENIKQIKDLLDKYFEPCKENKQENFATINTIQYELELLTGRTIPILTILNELTKLGYTKHQNKIGVCVKKITKGYFIKRNSKDFEIQRYNVLIERNIHDCTIQLQNINSYLQKIKSLQNG